MIKSLDREVFKAVSIFLPWPVCSVLHIPVMVKESILIVSPYYSENEGLKPCLVVSPCTCFIFRKRQKHFAAVVKLQGMVLKDRKSVV